MYSAKDLLVNLFVLLVIQPCFSIDSITANQTLEDGEFLISQGKIFQLGFFSPGSSGNRYIGVWYYKFPEQNVVWVANRDSPMINTSGVLAVDKTGQLVLFYRETPQVSIWSSNISLSGDNNNSAKLLDTGNLVLFKNTFSKKNFLWQGFDHPTDTYLPQMKIGYNKRTRKNTFITSWKSPENPEPGQYSYTLDVNGSVPQLFIYDGLKPLMRMGPWNGITYSGVPEYVVGDIDKISKLHYINNEEEVSTYYIVNDTRIITRFVLNDRGVAERLNWNSESQKWEASWTAPDGQCDTYANCGAFSTCNSFRVADQGCDCLPGYKDKSKGDSPTNSFEGCVRKPEALVCRNGEGFKKVSEVKVPDTINAQLRSDLGIKACNDFCLKNCSCTAYATANITNNIGCLTWYGELVDIREFSDGGQDLYLRVDHGELAKDSKKRILKVLLPVVFVIMLILVLAYWLLWNKKKRERENRNGELSNYFENDDVAFMERYSDVHATNERGTNSTEVHCFSLSTIIAATDNFSFSRKLGEGGFGTVYKGQLCGGHDIAVKRLSITSNQGLEEFRNEILLIAKLQHRNLVRLLGYCIQQEKMLIYEYLPNRGLDCFIFGGKSVLNWHTRFDIAMGIARGMIYLHQDSRLRIIHRDLKASNVLLDASMNPKISDFGMARIVGSNQNEDTTRRVVGTYGYMSPEYAMEGLFSIKSDVFSFGVLLLEIISGRRNSGSFNAENSLNLIGHVWDRWLEGQPLEVVDASLGDSYEVGEVLRCIHVGLLCVEESAAVRPTMSEVASMLCNERTTPSLPEQPAFINRATGYFGPVRSSSSSGIAAAAVTEMTVSLSEGR
ncbi:Receptor-like serine/threonine-protein kinase [Heracleum sosnowskyi]|uniref:Receptor-like serine/threonine-protein kinase n=1 Tax=Heracleum sosnowskyi TaxID=360622 RepID=A0AAD8I5R7_9APIA|nr:Receptor-like serine/threonine-protein kinase [Heracleum sosnowskyi]